MINIHINSHFAIGIIIASVFHYFFSFNLFEFLLIVCSSFIVDFDVLFSKYAQDHNHRMLITHSVVPSVIILVIGLILNWPSLIISGFAYFIHVFVDSFDWGVNFFYFTHKKIGLKLLISKEELSNISKYIGRYKSPSSFFDFKYYKNKVCLIIEFLLFIFMMIFIVIFAFEYILIVLIYLLGFFFHLLRHFRLKKIEAT